MALKSSNQFMQLAFVYRVEIQLDTKHRFMSLRNFVSKIRVVFFICNFYVGKLFRSNFYLDLKNSLFR